MDQYEAVMKLLMEMVKGEPEKNAAVRDDGAIPGGVSNRHVHLSQSDLDELFGAGLTKMKDLSQPGQYACKETVTVCGPKGAIEKVRILGPVRGKTQVEILAGDCFKLGLKAPARLSGDLDGTPGVTLVGPKGSVQTKDGKKFKTHIPAGVHDGQNVSLEVDGLRGGVLKNTIVRVTNNSGLECHIDTEEANAMGLDGSSRVKIIR